MTLTCEYCCLKLSAIEFIYIYYILPTVATFDGIQLIRLTSSLPVIFTVAICTDLCGKELHIQVGVGIVVTPGCLCDVMVAHWPGMPETWVRVPL